MKLSTLAQLISSRVRLLSGGIDNKRPRAWQEYGFPEHLGFDDLYNAYRRVDVAHGAVERLVEKCWQSPPWVIEGDETRNATAMTATERAWGKLFKDLDLWRVMKEADRRRLVGRYSGIILYWADGKPWAEPVEGTPRLAKLEAVWADQLKVESWYEDRDDPDTYGQPRTYTFTEPSFGGRPSQITTIHADRVFILGSMCPRSPAFLEPGYNQLVTIEKITGGSGESILKAAAQNVVLEYDKDVDLAQIAEANGLSMAEFQEFLDGRARDWGEGVDKMMALQGGRAVNLQPAQVDPTGAFNVAVSAFAASVLIPTKIIIGNQQGDRASTEDQKDFNARAQGRRVNQLAPDILAFLRHVARFGFIRIGDEVSVMWDDLTRPTRSERLADAKTMAETALMGISTGKPYYTDEEIRETAGYDGSAQG